MCSVTDPSFRTCLLEALVKILLTRQADGLLRNMTVTWCFITWHLHYEESCDCQPVESNIVTASAKHNECSSRSLHKTNTITVCQQILRALQFAFVFFELGRTS